MKEHWEPRVESANKYNPEAERGRYEGVEAVKRDPDVIASMRQLHEGLESLQQELSRLGARLVSVTRSEPTNKASETLTRQGQCALSCQIIEAINKIAELRRAVVEQTALLEI